MGRELGVLDDIINAAPTDGLWDDGRTDEDQLGLSYADLETAMKMANGDIPVLNDSTSINNINKFLKWNAQNSHKMKPIPVFKK